MKKGVELSLNAIIIAALVLTVLVVLIIVFTSEAGIFSKNVLTCEAKGGKCVPDNDCQYQKTNFKCVTKENTICCINPLSR